MIYNVSEASRVVGVPVHKLRYAVRMKYITTDVLRGKRHYFSDLNKIREFFCLPQV